MKENTILKLSFVICFCLFIFSCYMFAVSWRQEMAEQKTKKVWVNKEHTACHFQDTLEVNGVKYLKVYDRQNSGIYGDPYLVPVK